MTGSAALFLVFISIAFQQTIAFPELQSTTPTTNISVARQEEELGAAGNALQGVAVLIATFSQIIIDLTKLRWQANTTSTLPPRMFVTPPPSKAVMQNSQIRPAEEVISGKPSPQNIPAVAPAQLPIGAPVVTVANTPTKLNPNLNYYGIKTPDDDNDLDFDRLS